MDRAFFFGINLQPLCNFFTIIRGKKKLNFDLGIHKLTITGIWVLTSRIIHIKDIQF